MTSLYDDTAVQCMRKDRRVKTEPARWQKSLGQNSPLVRAFSARSCRLWSISEYFDKHREMPPQASPEEVQEATSIPGALPTSDDELDQKDNAAKGDGQNMTATKKNVSFEESSPAQEQTPKDKGEPLEARPIGELLVKKVADVAKNFSEEDPALQPRLQCWDLPGQEEYALCNLLYFQKRGIYVVFCDTSLDIEAGHFPNCC